MKKRQKQKKAKRLGREYARREAKPVCAKCGAVGEKMSGEICVGCAVLEQRAAHSRSFLK